MTLACLEKVQCGIVHHPLKDGFIFLLPVWLEVCILAHPLQEQAFLSLLKGKVKEYFQEASLKQKNKNAEIELGKQKKDETILKWVMNDTTLLFFKCNKQESYHQQMNCM